MRHHGNTVRIDEVLAILIIVIEVSSPRWRRASSAGTHAHLPFSQRHLFLSQCQLPFSKCKVTR